MEKSKVNIQEALEGIHFPSDVPQILATARANGAQKELLTLLDKLPERSYKNTSDINHSLGVIEVREGPIG